MAAAVQYIISKAISDFLLLIFFMHQLYVNMTV
jgi:hypothetical protein